MIFLNGSKSKIKKFEFLNFRVGRLGVGGGGSFSDFFYKQCKKKKKKNCLCVCFFFLSWGGGEV